MMERLASLVAPGWRVLLSAAAGLLAPLPWQASAQAASGTPRLALRGDLISIDPGWATAKQTRWHAFWACDTLFDAEAENRPQPQMVKLHEEGAGGTEHLFSLRPGLRFAWVRETGFAKARLLAEAIQRRGMEISLFIPYGILPTPSAYREELTGIVSVPETIVFWNIQK